MRIPRTWLLITALVLPASGCDWISTARNALRYPTIGRGEVENLATGDSVIYATLGEDGLALLDETTLESKGILPPPSGSESVDAVAIEGKLLFVLDARPPGYLAVYSLENPYAPTLLTPPRPVPVGPFSGVSARAGLSVVSGGTASLTAWRYDQRGLTDSAPVATADLGRGQPNALVGNDGKMVYVATHYFGPRFGIETIRLEQNRFVTVSSLKLPGAGFTWGGAKPASFPILLAETATDQVLVASGTGLSQLGSDGSVAWRLDLGAPVVGLAASTSFAFVAIAGESPALVQVSLEGTPRVIRRSSLPSGTKPLGVTLTRTSAVVAARERGVVTIR